MTRRPVCLAVQAPHPRHRARTGIFDTSVRCSEPIHVVCHGTHESVLSQLNSPDRFPFFVVLPDPVLSLLGLTAYDFGPESVSKAAMMADPCYLCGYVRSSMTWDHVEPKRRRGLRARWLHINAIGNTARSCYECNHAKGSDVLCLFLLKRRERTYRAEQEAERFRGELDALLAEREIRNAEARAKIAERRARREGAKVLHRRNT